MPRHTPFVADVCLATSTGARRLRGYGVVKLRTSTASGVNYYGLKTLTMCSHDDGVDVDMYAVIWTDDQQRRRDTAVRTRQAP